MSKIHPVTHPMLPDPMNPRIEPVEIQPLVDPDQVGTLTTAQRALIGLTQAIIPEDVRQEQMDDLQLSVDAVNAYIRSTQETFSIQFELHQRSGLTYALVRNVETGKVLKQIPTETLLNIAARVRQASGIFTNLST
jgi:uncharacterized FlaG/YvyC family protein